MDLEMYQRSRCAWDCHRKPNIGWTHQVSGDPSVTHVPIRRHILERDRLQILNRKEWDWFTSLPHWSKWQRWFVNYTYLTQSRQRSSMQTMDRWGLLPCCKRCHSDLYSVSHVLPSMYVISSSWAENALTPSCEFTGKHKVYISLFIDCRWLVFLCPFVYVGLNCEVVLWESVDSETILALFSSTNFLGYWINTFVVLTSSVRR